MSLIKVNPKHEKWLELYTSGMKPLEAYQKVYPNATKNAAYVETSKLKKKYRSRLSEIVEGNLEHMAMNAVNVIEDIMLNPKTRESVRLKAAISVIELSGHRPAMKVEVTVQDVTDSELDARLNALLVKQEAIEAEILDN